MSKLVVMAIYDQATGAFLLPQAMPSRAYAIRQFQDLARAKPEHELIRHADQYTVYELGNWDQQTGLFSDLELESLGTLQALCAEVKS